VIHHGDTETRSKLLHEKLTGKVIGAAVEVHRALKPGLLEPAYEECLCHELYLQNLRFERHVPLPVEYKNVKLDCGYRIDLVVEDALILELKCLEHILPVHEAQTAHISEAHRQASWDNHEFQCFTADAWRNRRKAFQGFLRVSVSPW
jgi:GxxExxY protein